MHPGPVDERRRLPTVPTAARRSAAPPEPTPEPAGAGAGWLWEEPVAPGVSPRRKMDSHDEPFRDRKLPLMEPLPSEPVLLASHDGMRRRRELVLRPDPDRFLLGDLGAPRDERRAESRCEAFEPVGTHSGERVSVEVRCSVERCWMLVERWEEAAERALPGRHEVNRKEDSRSVERLRGPHEGKPGVRDAAEGDRAAGSARGRAGGGRRGGGRCAPLLPTKFRSVPRRTSESPFRRTRRPYPSRSADASPPPSRSPPPPQRSSRTASSPRGRWSTSPGTRRARRSSRAGSARRRPSSAARSSSARRPAPPPAPPSSH